MVCPSTERILEAIERHDAEGARAAMRAHLLKVEGNVRERPLERSAERLPQVAVTR